MRCRRERGSVVLITAVALPVLIFVVGLGVDFGIMYAVRNAAQNAADAAAMAGVYEYACAQSGGNCPGQMLSYTSDSTGNTAAQHAFAADPFLGSSGASLNTAPPNGGYACKDTNGVSYYCYKATVTTTIPTFFARVFGTQSVPTTVVSTAMTSVGGLSNSPSCVRPVFIPDSAIPCTYTGPGTLSCPQGPIQLTNIRPTSPQSCTNGSCNCGTVQNPVACPSSTYYSLDFSSLLQDITNPSTAPQSLLSATNPVIFSDGNVVDNSGGGPNSPYADAWYQCTVTALHCGQYVRVQTGLTPTVTNNSINSLISESNSDTMYIFPIWDISGGVVNGNNMWVPVVGFAEMTNLHCTNATTGATEPCATGDNVQATYQTSSACPAGTGSNTGNNASGSYSYDIPVRLVQ